MQGSMHAVTYVALSPRSLDSTFINGSNHHPKNQSGSCQASEWDEPETQLPPPVQLPLLLIVSLRSVTLSLWNVLHHLAHRHSILPVELCVRCSSQQPGQPANVEGT